MMYNIVGTFQTYEQTNLRTFFPIKSKIPIGSRLSKQNDYHSSELKINKTIKSGKYLRRGHVNDDL